MNSPMEFSALAKSPDVIRVVIGLLVVSLTLFAFADKRNPGQLFTSFCSNCLRVYIPITLVPLSLGYLWVSCVNNIVPEPYLVSLSGFLVVVPVVRTAS
jgi:hypothetical protein